MNVNFSIDWTELSIQWMLTCGHFLWQGFVVAIVFLAIDRLATTHASTRYALAYAALLSLPVCVMLTFALVHNSRGAVLKMTSSSINNPVSLDDSVATSSPKLMLDSPIENPGNSTAIPQTTSNAGDRTAAYKAVTPQPLPFAQRVRFLAPVISAAYAIAAGLLLLRMTLSLFGSLKISNAAQRVTDSQFLQVVSVQAKRLKLKTVPIVATCMRVSSPVVVGILRPMILLPPSLTCGLAPTQLAAILCHEMAHIRRYDLFFNLVQRVIESLFFFHPMVWWLSHRVTIERENCCDDAAASYVGRLNYAEALVQMASICLANQRSRTQRLAALAADGGNSTDFGYRIRRLIDAQETPQIRVTKRRFAFCLATMALMGASLATFAQSPQTKKDESQVSHPNKDSVVELSFDDLKFDIEKDGYFNRSMLTKEIESLNNATIRIRGYILPQSVLKSRGFDEFVLVRDNQERCFGPGAALDDCLMVRMKKGETADFVTRPVAVQGKFEIKEFKYPYPDGEKHYAVYQLTATEVKHIPLTTWKPTKDGPAVEPADNLLEGNRNAAQNLDKVVKAGILRGKITVVGKIPKLSKLVPKPTTPRLPKRAPISDEEKKTYDALRAEIQASLVEIDDESLQIDADRGLANAFVYLAKAPADWQPTKADLKPVALTMQDYRFEPRAAIIRVGQDVRLINSGVAADNFHFEPRDNGAQNRLVMEGTEFTFERPFKSPEKTPIQAKSDMNIWKMTFLLPLDHPFAAVTDSQGRFSIEGLPPGTHTFQVWHECTGWLEKSLVVNIQAGQTTEVDRSFDLGNAGQSVLRKDLVNRIEAAMVQRDKASKDSSDYPRLNHRVQIKELHLAQFDLENGIAGIDLPDAPEATPERIAELRELLRFRWGLPVDGIQVGIARTDDRIRFTAGEKIPFQIFIRNITQEPITQSLRWGDAKDMTASLRRLAGFDTDKNIFLSLRPNSLPSQPTELRLEPGVTMELPLGQFELDTVGLHSGVYYVDGHFPVVFPNQEGELATRVATPVDSSAMPHDLFFRFELVGPEPTPQSNPADQVKDVAEYADVQWGKTVYGLQAGARYRNNDEPSSKADTNNSETKVEPTQHPIRIGDTIKTELLVRNVSDQPITVRFHPSAGSEVQMLSAMQSNLTEVSSRGIMRRSDVPIAHDSDRTVERTLQPSEVFVAALQDFEIQLLLDGRERPLELPKANRHWVKGSGDYTYTAYLKLNITDSLSVSLHSGSHRMHIIADDNPLGPIQDKHRNQKH